MAVVATVDPESAAQLAWAAGEGGPGFHGPPLSHPPLTGKRFHRPHENRARIAWCAGDEVQVVVQAIDEKDISMAGWSIHHLVAKSAPPAVAVRSLVRDTQVGFGLDNTT